MVEGTQGKYFLSNIHDFLRFETILIDWLIFLADINIIYGKHRANSELIRHVFFFIVRLALTLMTSDN